jgi:hypothetical protein
VAHYLFNFSKRDAAEGQSPGEHVAELLRVQLWGVDAEEPHTATLLLPATTPSVAPSLPQPSVIWTPYESQVYPGGSPSGVLLVQIEEWDPPVQMSAVLPRIDPTESNPYIQANARHGFQTGVVRITAPEYETVLAVRAEGLP